MQEEIRELDKEFIKEFIYVEPVIQIRKRRTSKEKGGLTPSFRKPGKQELNQQTEQEEYYFESITPNEVINDKNDYIIVGESGIGKTSFLYWLQAQLLEGIYPGFTPVLLKLKDIAEFKSEDELISIIDTQYGIKDKDLKGGGLLFLLDGLDQITKYDNIAERLKDKDIFSERNKIIFTSRPVGYDWIKDKLRNYGYLSILRFDEKRIREYMGGYYNDIKECYK
ncbi:MAG: NACHT domain-containing protein [bacterium]